MQAAIDDLIRKGELLEESEFVHLSPYGSGISTDMDASVLILGMM
jgi:hypothetical protein